MKFRTFISEEKEKTTVFAFGRMNPPTIGHEKLVDKVKSEAEARNADHLIVISHKHHRTQMAIREKNPLLPEQKLKYAKRFFPEANIVTSSKENPSYLTHAAALHKSGTTHLVMVAGSDRVDEYKNSFHEYNGEGEGKLFNFKSIKVVSAGERDPDAEGAEGMSASKMRAHAKAGNFDEFKKGIPSHVPEHHAMELFNDVRAGMQPPDKPKKPKKPKTMKEPKTVKTMKEPKTVKTVKTMKEPLSDSTLDAVKLPRLLMTPEQIAEADGKGGQLSFMGYTTKNFDVEPRAKTMFQHIIDTIDEKQVQSPIERTPNREKEVNVRVGALVKPTHIRHQQFRQYLNL